MRRTLMLLPGLSGTGVPRLITGLDNSWTAHPDAIFSS
jgi:hypothetical protein